MAGLLPESVQQVERERLLSIHSYLRPSLLLLCAVGRPILTHSLPSPSYCRTHTRPCHPPSMRTSEKRGGREGYVVVSLLHSSYCTPLLIPRGPY